MRTIEHWMSSLDPVTWVYVLLIGVIILGIGGIVAIDNWWGRRLRQKEIDKAWEVYFKDKKFADKDQYTGE